MPNRQQRCRKTAILTLKGLQKLEAAKLKAPFLNRHAKTYTLETLSEYTGLSPHTLSKIHTCKAGVDIRSLARYFNAFNLTLEPDDYHQLFNSERSESNSSVYKPDQPWQSNDEQSYISMVESSNSQTIVSWGIAPDVSHFYGRTTELATLQQWILEERCRLVTLLGMGGIGKTWLATKLAEQMQHQFKAVIWRSLQPISGSHPPLPFCHFLDDLIHHLTPHPIPKLSEPIAVKIQQVINLLRSFPCLLVLDNVDPILQSPILSNISDINLADHTTEQTYSDDEAYRNFFKYLGQGRHQSCIVLTSRAEPQPAWFLSGTPSGIRLLSLQGLPVTGIQQLFSARGTFQGTVADWEYLTNYYKGNPLLLCIVLGTIQRSFNGNIADFLKHNGLVYADLCQVLEQQLGEVPNLEKNVFCKGKYEPHLS